jgi:hypothetical protein
MESKFQGERTAMRYEERNDTHILVVEPGDERGAVRHWLHQWQQSYSRKSAQLIVVVPQDAVFRRPGDLRELQQAVGQREWGIPLVLVIEGNERLRLWARRQGFSVYATLETCLKAVQPQGAIPGGSEAEPERAVAIEQLSPPPFTGHGARPTYSDRDSDTLGETYRSGTATVASRTTSGSQRPGVSPDQRVRSVFWFTSSTHNTEPLLAQDLYGASIAERSITPLSPLIHEYSPVATPMLDDSGMVEEWSNWSEQTNDVDLEMGMAPEMVPIVPQAPFSTDTTFSLKKFDETPVEWQVFRMESWWGIVLLHLYTMRQDRLLLVLIVLVALGILGGVGCGYRLCPQ